MKVPCKKCGAMILPATAADTAGMCRPCANAPYKSLLWPSSLLKELQQYQEPPAKQGRFRDNCDGTLVDTVSGLMWTKQRYPTPFPFSDEGFGMAREVCRIACFAGFRDWRLPTQEELKHLYQATRKQKRARFRWEPANVNSVNSGDTIPNSNVPNMDYFA